MKGAAVSLMLVLSAIDIFGGIIQKREELPGLIESGNDGSGLDQRNQGQDASLAPNADDDNDSDGNSPLLSDANDVNHPHHSTADKHKRCPSYRLGSALNSRSGIVGVEPPQSLERRDLQSQFYGKMCVTCLARHSCNAVNECPVCERWCTKVPIEVNEGNPTDEAKVENGPIVSPNLGEPVVAMSSRSNFEEDSRKNVYTVATLRTGNVKEAILKLLGITGTEDIDTVVVWVTTRSNNPPFISNGLPVEPVQDAEQLIEDIRNQPQSIPSTILDEANLDGSEVLSSVNPEVRGETEILPRYPIESTPGGFIVHQSMNPDIIEGPPSLAVMNGGTDLDNPPNKQGNLPQRDTPPDFLLREESQPSAVRTLDESRMIRPIDQASNANLRSPMREQGSLLSETMDNMRAQSNQLKPRTRMREFLEDIKAKNPMSSRMNIAINSEPSKMNQFDTIAPRAREAMERFKSIQIPKSFQRLNVPDENNFVAASERVDHQAAVGVTDHDSTGGQRSGFTENNDIPMPQSEISHHGANDQGGIIDPREMGNDILVNPDNENQVRQGFVPLEERNDINLRSQNIDPKNMMEFSEDEGTFNPQSRSYGNNHLQGEQAIAKEEISNQDGTSSKEGLQTSIIEDPSKILGAVESEVIRDDPERIQTNSVGPSESNSLVDRTPSALGTGMARTKLGARTNELLQKIKEKQDARKQILLDAKESLNSVLEGMKAPVINNFDKADTASGGVQEVAEELQQGTGTPTNSLNNIPKRIIQTQDTSVDGYKDDKIAQEKGIPPQMFDRSDVVGSQPLEDSFERIQPFSSLSGRPWHNHVSTPDDSGSIKPSQEPSLGSTNVDLLRPESNLNDGNLNLGSRSQFEETPVSNALGAIIPGEKEMDISFQKPSDIYFIGNGIKLPLQMLKKADGAVHFSVDMEKMCSCNNGSCPKNHTDIEKTVETILEKEAELKDQLVHTAEDVVGEPVTAASNNQLTLGEQFENFNRRSRQEEMGDVPVGMAASSHRDQRDTVRKFLEMKNRIASSNFESAESQSDGASILKRSLVEKTDAAGTEKLDNVRTITIKPILQTDRKNMTKMTPLTKTASEDTSKSATQDKKIDAVHQTKVQNMKHLAPNFTKETATQKTTSNFRNQVQNIDQFTPSFRETVTQKTASYFQDFMGRKIEEIKSRMSEMEKRNQALSKDLGFPQNLLGNFWNPMKDAMAETGEENKQSTTPQPTPQSFNSRIQDIFNRSLKKDLELYDNLASITKPYQFKDLEKKMQNTINQYTKKDDEIVKDESVTLQSMNEDPIIKKEVGIASNILKFFKDLASDRSK